MNSTREKKSQATIKLNIQIVWNWNSKIKAWKQKNKKCLSSQLNLKCQNKTEKKYNQEYYNKKY